SIVITLWSMSLSQSASQLNPGAGGGGTITFTSVLSTSVTESLTIRNEVGTVVRTLVNVSRPTGTYTDQWDGKNAQGALLPDGGYFVVETLTDSSGSTVYDPASQQNWRSSSFISQSPPLAAYNPFKNLPLVITY